MRLSRWSKLPVLLVVVALAAGLALSRGDAGGQSGVCQCPESVGVPPKPRTDCESFGRPCDADADCGLLSYPAGGSRAATCGRFIWFRSGFVIEGSEKDVRGGTHVREIESVNISGDSELVLTGQNDTILILRLPGRLLLSGKIRVGSNGLGQGSLSPERVL